jgi:hypothetical protein
MKYSEISDWMKIASQAPHQELIMARRRLDDHHERVDDLDRRHLHVHTAPYIGREADR